MIDEQNPNEDEITKIDLLHRMDSFRSLVESFRGQVGDQIEGMKQSVPQELTAKILEGKKAIEQFGRDIDSKLRACEISINAAGADTQAALGRKLDETIGRIDQKFSQLREDVYGKLDTSLQSVELDARNAAVNSRKELELIVNNSISGMVARVTDMRRYLDARLSNLESETLKTAEMTVEKRLAELMATSKSMEQSLENCRKETSEAMTRFQAETMQKVSKMFDLFNDIKNKFSIIANALK